MSPATVASKPVLVYDRIAQNRRKTVLLVALTVFLTIPFVAAVSFGVSETMLRQFGPHPRMSRAAEKNMQSALDAYRRSGQAESEYNRALGLDLERQIHEIQAERQQQEAATAGFRLQMRVLVGGSLAALLALLFWSLASSPTSKVLSMCGARPAGTAENEAKRLLEGLAASAGLPTPKLYVIDSTTPNAFAAGTDPAHSIVAVTQGLLTLLDRAELQAVLAHELSHIGNRDTGLNTVVFALALFLRLPYLLLRRKIRSRREAYYGYTPAREGRTWYRMMFTVAMLPAIVYVFVIAPILAVLIRSAISRGREFLADADATLLTGNPEGLMRALAKIGGAGSVVTLSNPVISHLYFADPAKPGLAAGLFRGSLLATHPPIDKRITRLMEFHGRVSVADIEEAVHEGAEFTRYHPPMGEVGVAQAIKQDEISVLTEGNPMGRVYRVLSATALYDRADLKSSIVARVPAGALLVVFDDPGRFRQVLTHDQTFGYMPAAVKMQKVDMIPAEIHDPAARAAVLASLDAPAAASSRSTVSAPPSGSSALTLQQLAIVAGLGIVVFTGIFLAMWKFGGH
ncbi:MAG TPA: M48 family metalloprotease [Bryobacteraceae bacterium]